jgi:hypothetical protein
MATAAEVEAKIDGHIDVCAVRYEGIEIQMKAVNARLKRIETIMVTAAGGLILGGFGIAGTLFMLMVKMQ